MSTSHNADALPTTLPLGTPAKEWAQELLASQTSPSNPPNTDESSHPKASSNLPILPVAGPGSTLQSAGDVAAKAEREQAAQALTESHQVGATDSQLSGEAAQHPGMSRGDSKASVATTEYGMPGSWSKEWPASTADQTFKDASAALNTAGQTLQNNFNTLTSPNGPVATHPYVQTAVESVQQTVGGLVDTVRSAVGQSPTQTEQAPHIAGLLPPAEHTGSTPAASTPTREIPSHSESKLSTGGAMINTHPPSGDIHPATSDYNTSQTSAKQRQPSGPSPVDGIMPGTTRANPKTTHAGNYAYTELPNSEGNALDPHDDGKGVLDRAREAVAAYTGSATSPTSGEGAGGVGYLQQAMAAVGLGGAAAVAETELEEKPQRQTSASTAAPAPFDPKENILSPADARTSIHGPDADVQEALAKVDGLAVDSETPKTGGVEAFNKSAAREHDLSAEVGKTPHQAPVGTTMKESGIAIPDRTTTSTEHQTGPIQTTSNVYPKAEVANPSDTGYDEHAAATKDLDAIKTTTNVHDKAVIATSPATNVEATTTVKPRSTDKTSAEHYRDATNESSTSSAPSSPSSGKGHKRGPSLKDKIRGEMKIITGKIGRNEAKVEEGKALKSGGGITSPTSTQ